MSGFRGGIMVSCEICAGMRVHVGIPRCHDGFMWDLCGLCVGSRLTWWCFACSAQVVFLRVWTSRCHSLRLETLRVVGGPHHLMVGQCSRPLMRTRIRSLHAEFAFHSLFGLLGVPSPRPGRTKYGVVPGKKRCFYPERPSTAVLHE